MTAPLKACCGMGGAYNVNKEVTCGHTGMVDNNLINLTVSPPCPNSEAHIIWDGMHTCNTFNKVAVTEFLTGEQITPKDGLNCSPDFSLFESSTLNFSIDRHSSNLYYILIHLDPVGILHDSLIVVHTAQQVSASTTN